jgi:heme/copper-type cytochrome/quinol oxidase subunit 2
MKKLFFACFLFLLVSVGMINAMAMPEASKGEWGGNFLLIILFFLVIIGFVFLWVKALLRVFKSYPDAKNGFDAAAWAITFLFLVPPIGVILSFTIVKKQIDQLV